MSWLQSDLQYTEPAYIPPEWSSGTDAEIVEALEKHYAGEIDLTEYWAVGDERVVHLSAMSALSPLTDTHAAQDVTLVLVDTADGNGYWLIDPETGESTTDHGVFIVGQKYALEEKGQMYPYNDGWIQYDTVTRRTWCDDIYRNSFPETLKPIFKKFWLSIGTVSYHTSISCYFALWSGYELFGTASGVDNSSYLKRMKYFETEANIDNLRRSPNTNHYNGWLRSYRNNGGYANYFYLYSSSSTSYTTMSSQQGLAPFGVI